MPVTTARAPEGSPVDDVDWDRTAFALICPDALARHLGFAILDRVGDAGFAPVAWRVIWHRPDNLDAFHERNISQAWQAYLYRLVDQLFGFGPAIALLLEDQRRDPEGHGRLRAEKGPSDPARSGPGTIRGDLGSINAMLSLLHTADSPADSARESAVFTGAGGFTHGDEDDLRTVIELLALSRPRETRDYPEVVAGLRARALTAAWPELPRPMRKTAGELLAAGTAELARPESGERLACLLDQDHPLARLLRASFTPAAPGPDPQRVAVTLATFGTGIDDWERLVLATCRRFWPRLATQRGHEKQVNSLIRQ
jgi:nucleoside diphosphate kinase